MRFETGPGEQAQVDFGQLRVWIAEVATPVHFFVFTLGYLAARRKRSPRLQRRFISCTPGRAEGDQGARL